MSSTETKTFTRIPLPEDLDPKEKYESFISKLAAESTKTWFSGNHFLEDSCTWECIAESGNEEMSAFADLDDASTKIAELIRECLTIRYSYPKKQLMFQVYRDSHTYGDEAHDWILRELLKDEDLKLSSVQTHFVDQDSREGMSVSVIDKKLDSNGDLISQSIYKTDEFATVLEDHE